MCTCVYTYIYLYSFHFQGIIGILWPLVTRLQAYRCNHPVSSCDFAEIQRLVHDKGSLYLFVFLGYEPQKINLTNLKKEIYWKYSTIQNWGKGWKSQKMTGSRQFWGSRNNGTILSGVTTVMNELLQPLSVHSGFSVHVENTCLANPESYAKPLARGG